MIIKKKRKEFHEAPVQKKKKVKTIIEIEEDVQTVIKTEDNGHLKKKMKTKKKENLKDECLHKLQPKNNKKKKKKKKVGSELLSTAHLKSFVNIKGPVDLQLQDESEEQIKILKKKKKKVQYRFSLENNESSDVELSNHHTDGTKKNELPFKKKRKKTALDLELDGEVKKKKKKKGSFSLEDIQDSAQKQSAKVYRDTHKYISPEAVFMCENNDTGNAQNDGESCVRRKKKKKKDKSDCFLLLADNQDHIHQVPGRPTALSDIRKRRKHNSWEYSLTRREEEDKIKNFGSIKERKKKRKYLSSSTCEEDKPDYSHSFLDKYLPAQQEVELEEELSGKKHRKNFKDNNEVSKKKRKIKKKEKETTYSEVSLNNVSTSESQKILLESSKKNKESEMERAECVTGDVVDGTLCNSNPVQRDRKRKNRKKVPPQDLAEEPGSKAETEKIKTESPWDESLDNLDGVIIVQEKKGNCDEINIDKVRRQALQEEIDRESGKTKAFSSKVGQDMKLGQWSTAAFKSSEEQMKFFRLMGGFKKGSVPIQSPSAPTKKPNMALNKEGEQKLQQALKMEFDKAMDLKQHRGIGLGFQPIANKKAYIDKYASRSIKFED
ncbi:lysine-rich nucleolar protein 1 isoform X2 [Hirundo rustica]|nr:lysine-rich nucleolar protein 1 isoform X2 [Hirundo rustica]XP_039935221.1 lysine-rich nucleolar protein 1 isoform X2 [Hirundo rustica]XP_039935223.1 lysine-rich nucleolar protein 1 isoform X2 [Hirundo rustica]XP_039935224.1 lysine-rich nucleolar protein 1 isoform X2 [Hirundo rustica]